MALSRVIVPLTLLCTSCSLMDLTVAPPRCSSNDDCLALNELEGIPVDVCRPFYCADDGRCLRFDNGQEIWDNADNDCDGLIDEPTGPGPEGQTIRPVLTAFSQPLPADVTGLCVDASADGRITTLVSAGEATLFFIELTSDLETVHAIDVPQETNVWDEEDCESSFSEGLHSWPTVGEARERELVDAALTHGGAELLVTALNTTGFADGQLRVGTIGSGSDATSLVMRGPWTNSNAFAGVQTSTDGPQRAAQPTIAAIEEEDRALLAWLDAARSRETCAGSPVDVLAAEVFRSEGVDGNSWLNLSNETAPGVITPTILGQTNGGGAAAIQPFEIRGYFVAFGNTDDALALRWVPSIRRAPAINPECSLDDVETARVGWLTDSLGDVIGFPPLRREGPVDQVSLALGSRSADGVELGAVWREGCGADETIFFQKIRVLEADGAFSGDIERTDAVQLSLPDESGLSAPALTYLDAGFLAAGSTRGDRVIDESSDGGWYVLWTSADRTVLRRLSEADGAPLHADERIEIVTPGADSTLSPAVITRHAPPAGVQLFLVADDELLLGEVVPSQ